MSSVLPKNNFGNSNFCPSLLEQKFFLCFLEELKKQTKCPFKINFPKNGHMEHTIHNYWIFLSPGLWRLWSISSSLLNSTTYCWFLYFNLKIHLHKPQPHLLPMISSSAHEQWRNCSTLFSSRAAGMYWDMGTSPKFSEINLIPIRGQGADYA